MSALLDALAGARVYDLEQPRSPRDPIHPNHAPPGYAYLMHRRHEATGGPLSGTSGVIVSSDHAGTHIDALGHIAEDLRLHGGADALAAQTSQGMRSHSIADVAPIVARGWLLDLGDVEPGRWIGLEEVRSAAGAQGVELRRGDVLLVRTGNGAHWNDPPRYLDGSGMAGEVSEWLAATGVRAVGADNVAWDRPEGIDPLTRTALPGHVLLLVRAGIHIVENLFLEDLAADGVREFVFVCLPLKMRGATGSPVRPVALVG